MECHKEIENYILLKQIKSGPITDMFVGIFKEDNKIVFIKRIRRSGLDEETKIKLSRKITLLHNLRNSSYIIHYKALDKNEKNYYYLIFEYCNGGNLLEYAKDYIKENKEPINEFFVRKIIKKLVSGIEFLRSEKIIHSNIKLENILLNFDDFKNVAENGKLPKELTFENKSLKKSFTVKIADFKEHEKLTEENGTYSLKFKKVNNAPENLNSKSYEADLWSLGAITYELLTGLPPFEAKTSDGIFKSIQEGKYALPINLKCSLEIITFINELLEYNPKKRLNLEQIKSQPFLNKNPEEFQYINLSRNEKEKIEKSSKDNDNLFWNYFKCDDLDFNINKITQEEIQKNEFQKMLKKAEEKREKLKLEVIKADSEEEIKKCQLENENLKKRTRKITYLHSLVLTLTKKYAIFFIKFFK